MAFNTYVVGLEHHDGIRKCEEGDTLILIREPNNPHDKNAIAVHTMEGHKVGYIRRQVSENLSDRLDEGETLIAEIIRLNKPSFFERIFGNQEPEVYAEFGTISYFSRKHNWSDKQIDRAYAFLNGIPRAV